MSLLVNREVILAGIESTYNVDPTLTPGSNSILVEEPAWANEGLRMVERPAVRANINMLQQIYAGRLVTLTFTCEIKGSGTAGTPPEIGPLLRMCGFAETIAASTSVTYEPASSGHESGTLYYYQDGKRLILTGCRANPQFALETGSVAKVTFTITGHVAPQTDEAIVTPSYDATVPAPLIGAGFSVGGYSAVINALNLDMANQLAFPPSINASDGYGEVRITRRDPNGSFDPEDTLVATNDWLGDFTAGNTLALDTGTIGSAGNQFQLTMPGIYYREIAPGDREGIRTLETTFGCTESSGDDEVSLAFT